ncbi:ribosomal protein mL2, mitochondrial [Acrasis kona]|uniref:Ribosomal protein mL2, mitochondrial n=1 Tax=Acrasis kona TaxID=1008807 RepID=A0AAW2YPK1_9EUKA
MFRNLVSGARIATRFSPRIISCPSIFSNVQVRTATKKSGGSTKQNSDNKSRRPGFKIHHGFKIKAGEIIIRQKGNKFWPSYNVVQGKDFTLHAMRDGWVQIVHDPEYDRKYVMVAPRLADIEKQTQLVQNLENEKPFKPHRTLKRKMGRNVANHKLSLDARKNKTVYELRKASILPRKRYPRTQVHRIPKMINYQIKYVEDVCNIKSRCQFKTNRLPPVKEPTRIGYMGPLPLR